MGIFIHIQAINLETDLFNHEQYILYQAFNSIQSNILNNYLFIMIEAFLKHKRLFQQSRKSRQHQNVQLNATSFSRFSQAKLSKDKRSIKHFDNKKFNSFYQFQQSQFSDNHSFVPKILIKLHSRRLNKSLRRPNNNQLVQGKRNTIRLNIFSDGNNYFSESYRKSLKPANPAVRSVSQFIASSQNIQLKIKKPIGNQFAIQGVKKSLVNGSIIPERKFTPERKLNTTLFGFKGSQRASIKGSIRQYKKNQHLIKQNQKIGKSFRGDKDMFDLEVIGRCHTFQQQYNPWQSEQRNESTSFELF